MEATLTASIPENHLAATRERVAEALTIGGKARLTVRSRKTGKHLELTYTAKKAQENGSYISRATLAGRVGLPDASVVFIDNPYGDEGFAGDTIARFYPETGEFKPLHSADPAHVWAAEKVLAWALGTYDLDAQAEVFIASECSICGRRLDDPVSIERGIGPECFSRKTGSKHV